MLRQETRHNHKPSAGYTAIKVNSRRLQNPSASSWHNQTQFKVDLSDDPKITIALSSDYRLELVTRTFIGSDSCPALLSICDEDEAAG